MTPCNLRLPVVIEIHHVQIIMKRIGKYGARTSFVVDKPSLKRALRGMRGGAGGGGIGNCQELINNDLEQGKNEWLQLLAVLQNIEGKGIATMLGKIETRKVVIKVQLAEQAQREYAVHEKLHDCKGIIPYSCMFTCDGDKDYIESFGTHKEMQHVCKGKGTSMGVIIMPFYEKRALEDALKNGNKIDLKLLLKSVIQNYFSAFLKHGFTHGDFFTKNVLLDDKGEPVLIDFEKSAFDGNATTFWRDIDDLLGDIGRYVFRIQLDDIARVVMINRAYNIPPSPRSVEDLVGAIERLL